MAGARWDGESWCSGTCKPQPVGHPYCSSTQEEWSDIYLWCFIKSLLILFYRLTRTYIVKARSLFVTLVGAKKFTKLDLSQAYISVDTFGEEF